MHINLKNKKKGFSLLEMMAVLGIFGIISSIVMFNYGKFTSETMLTNMAYEVALSIREAQIYGVSVRNAGEDTPSFNAPYGIHIPPTGDNLNQYILFKDNDDDGDIDASSCLGSLECITPYTIQRNIFITSVKTRTGGGCPSRNDGFSILFKRPNPEPFFSVGGNGVAEVEITLESRDGTTQRYVIIANNGQISVQNEPICD